MQPFLAMIIPVGSGSGVPPSPGVPTHPIYYPPQVWPQPPGGGTGAPPGTWGGSGQPFPTPPIANVPGAPGWTPPSAPPGTWGGSGEPFPTPPIVIPPQKPGDPPLVIWGPGDPRPTPPIEIGDEEKPPVGGEPVRLVEWKTAWTEETGWVVVGIPQVPTPTPSAAPAKK